MKIFFDTNVYIAEALVGHDAIRIIDATERGNVTNDRHMLRLDPFEGLRIISMNAYHDLLEEEGLLRLP